MRTRTAAVVAAVVSLSLSAGAMAATTGHGKKASHVRKAKVVAFHASYAGKATTAVNGSAVKVAAKGAGKGTLVGKSTIAGKGGGTVNDQDQCALFTGPGKIVSKASKTGVLKFTVLSGSSGCATGNDQNQITVKGRAKVVGGTKTLRKAKGTLEFTGHLDRGTGVFNVKFSGSLRA